MLWSRSGELSIISPFINDFDLNGKDLSAHIMRLANLNTDIKIITAGKKLGNRHENISHTNVPCHQCENAAKIIQLLDSYARFSHEILIQEDLHAKIYTSTDRRGIKKCLVGSANLTKSGFEKWCEIGIYTTDATLIQNISNKVEGWKIGQQNITPPVKYRDWRRETVLKYPRVASLV